MRNVDAILVADIHIRESQPECRLDNFMETQERKHQWLKKLQSKYDCPILCAGDLFDYWKPSPWLLGWTFRNLANGIIAVPGQHDLPAHNLENITKSGIQVLSDGDKIKLITNPDNDYHTIKDYEVLGFPWGFDWNIDCDAKEKIALIHYGVYESKPHYPGAENTGGTAKSVMKKLPGYDLIVSGDNHLTFIQSLGSQLLVNPGSFTRQTAAQADHKPCVFLWDSKSNEVEKVYVPIEQNVISREHIEKVKERDERLESFISKLDNNVELSISFKNNLRNHIAVNNVDKDVIKIIWECVP